MNKAVATDKGAASRIKTLDKQLTELKGQQAVGLYPAMHSLMLSILSVTLQYGMKQRDCKYSILRIF